MFRKRAAARMKRINRASPTQMVFLWFGFFVLLGTFLLWLPWSQRGPEANVDFVSALFTAVSAACVTGLTVVSLHDTFSPFGQFVILLLIEMGGMGIMTFAVFGYRLIGRRLSLTQQAAVTNAMYQSDAASDFKHTFMRIFGLTVLLQLVGAVIMACTLLPRLAEGEGVGFLLWSSLFHSVSAFCNCGFTLYQDDLLSLRDNIPFLVTVLVLIVLGSLGHIVLVELQSLPGLLRHRVRKPFMLSLHTRVVLVMTVLLIVPGVLVMWLLGTGEEGGGTWWNAVFETISGRTAGFSIVGQAQLPLASIVFMLFLMFIGGSPGSCAGGIKTTSLAIWVARVRANLRNDASVNMFGFTVAPDLVSRARILMAVSVLWNVTGIFLLSILHPGENLQTLAFEQISAFGTVGLSMEFTARLTMVSRMWIILSMFVGRLGPLSIALLVWSAPGGGLHRPVGRIMVG